MASVTAFLEGRLRLKVNRQKSAVAPVGERQFLGHRLGHGGTLGIGPKSLDRAKDRLREITHRERGQQSLEQRIAEVNRFTTGWVSYYRDAQLPNSAEGYRPMATPQASLRASQALQEPSDDRRLPAQERCQGQASTTTGLVGKRMVAALVQPASQVGHAPPGCCPTPSSGPRR